MRRAISQLGPCPERAGTPGEMLGGLILGGILGVGCWRVILLMLGIGLGRGVAAPQAGHVLGRTPRHRAFAAGVLLCAPVGMRGRRAQRFCVQPVEQGVSFGGWG